MCKIIYETYLELIPVNGGLPAFEDLRNCQFCSREDSESAREASYTFGTYFIPHKRVCYVYRGVSAGLVETPRTFYTENPHNAPRPFIDSLHTLVSPVPCIA